MCGWAGRWTLGGRGGVWSKGGGSEGRERGGGGEVGRQEGGAKRGGRDGGVKGGDRMVGLREGYRKVGGGRQSDKLSWTSDIISPQAASHSYSVIRSIENTVISLSFAFSVTLAL